MPSGVRGLGLCEMLLHEWMTPEGRETAVGEHADVALLPSRDLGDLAVGETLAPEIDGLALWSGKRVHELPQPDGEFTMLGRRGGAGGPVDESGRDMARRVGW